jgi:prolyl-tRNA editing enzyme YbaK/EbsC (Cys-tRNA(Pro) deacylase)
LTGNDSLVGLEYKSKFKEIMESAIPQIRIPKKVDNFLAKSGTKYELVGHRTVYTAFDKAMTLKVKPGAIAKVLVIKMGGELAMAVIGGDRNLDMDKLRKIARPKGRGPREATKKIDFAKEKIIGETFKGIDPGAVPPFAGLWNLKVFCDKKLLESPKIILSAGSYEASIKMAPGAFKKVNSEMVIGSFSIAKPKPKTKPKKKPAKPTKKRK